TDTGIGMDPEIQKRIFEPFFTTKEPGRGTGLGLAMVYGSIKAHDGSITVESDPGRGTTFRILLPATHEAEVTDADEEVISGSGRVLIVDDEEILRAIGRAMLESMGYDVLLAVNGREAVDLFKKMPEEIDLVILDMIMPVMGGKETLAELKKIRSDCRILVASGFARESELSEMKKLGINGSIRKPFRLAELSRAIAGVMGCGVSQSR
ncbi:MAG TPA: response regulator, partial [Candidatus Rifleibacterium sp.]|nr:response regulator [Candidatus Rifleibacterium sp.]